jgi:sulfatase maturation enzyme AslB (radical SAM superfamily)
MDLSASGRSRLWLWLDVCSACNLSCRHCYTLNLQQNRRMSLEEFRKYIDVLSDERVEVVKCHLNWRGEPSLNRELPSMLATLWEKVPNWPVEWHTNATAISQDFAEALVNAHPTQCISLSLDGGNQQTFESNRGLGSWKRAIEGARRLVAARRRQTSVRLQIHQIDLGAKFEDFDPEFVELLRTLDSFKSVYPVTPNGRFVQLDSSTPKPRGPCFWLGNALCVAPNGDAFTCLLSSGSRLGSLIDDDVISLWNRARSWRGQMQTGGRPCVVGCKDCEMREGSEWSEGAEVGSSHISTLLESRPGTSPV